MEVPVHASEKLQQQQQQSAVGMKRQREQRVSWSDRDADGDRIMESEADDGATCLRDDRNSDSDNEPSRKRAMLIKTNLRFLEKIPPLRDYQRARNGRRGAIDGGTMAGPMMLAALEESFEETSFVTLEPPTREALVAPAPSTATTTSTRPPRVSTELSPIANLQRIRQVRPTSRPVSFAKDDEARPASG